MKRNITLLSVFLLFAFMQAMGQTTYTVTLYVTAVTGQDLEGTPVVLENVNTGLVYNRALDSDGTCTITRVLAGTHMLTITPRDLALYSSEIEVTDNMSLEIELVEEVRTPYALTASTSHDNKTGYNEVALMWNRETDYFFDDFESYDAFSIDFAPWTGIDGDHVPAAQLYGSYPNSGLNQYATIFNPLVIDPPVWYTYPETICRIYTYCDGNGQQRLAHLSADTCGCAKRCALPCKSRRPLRRAIFGVYIRDWQ